MEAGESGGFIRLTARKSDHRILGIQAVGAHVAELASTFTVAIEMGTVVEDIAATIFAHPTLGETLHEASLRVLGQAVHM